MLERVSRVMESLLHGVVLKSFGTLLAKREVTLVDLWVGRLLDVAGVQVGFLEERWLLDGISSDMVSHCSLTLLWVDPLTFSFEE